MRLTTIAIVAAAFAFWVPVAEAGCGCGGGAAREGRLFHRLRSKSVTVMATPQFTAPPTVVVPQFIPQPVAPVAPAKPVAPAPVPKLVYVPTAGGGQQFFRQRTSTRFSGFTSGGCPSGGCPNAR